MQVSCVTLSWRKQIFGWRNGERERGTKPQVGPWIPYPTNSSDAKGRLKTMAGLPKEALLQSEKRLTVGIGFWSTVIPPTRKQPNQIHLTDLSGWQFLLFYGEARKTMSQGAEGGRRLKSPFPPHSLVFVLECPFFLIDFNWLLPLNLSASHQSLLPASTSH